MDIYQAAKWQGKYPPLTTNTKVNSRFSIMVLKSVIINPKKYNLAHLFLQPS